jgi:hypothetical protein
MPFQPNIHDELTIDGITYRIAEHPAAPGIPYGQEGRAGIVYCLETLTPSPSPAQPPGVGVRAALKVFKPRFRMPYLVSQAEKLAAFADLPGLQAARRRVLTRVQNPDLLQQHPDLIYAVLMPWIEGPTWLEVLLEKRPLSPQQALHMARGLAQVLEVLELRGLAHCDLSAPNVMLPLLAGGTGVELVDLEGLYAPGMTRPQELSSGSAGYAHRQATGGLWGPEADRFAGAVLLAEMLGWCDPQVVQATWGESYFAPQEMQQDTPRYRTLVAALERRWGSNVARLFERAWRSDSLLDCPTFGEWMVALPLTPSPQPPSPLPQAGEGKGVAAQPPGEEVRAAVDSTAEIRAFMQAARRMEDRGNLEGALETYRQALELARADPSLRSLAREIELTVQDVEKRVAAQPSRLQPAVEIPAPPSVSPLSLGEGPGVRAEPRRKPGWGFWLLWVLASTAGWTVGGAVSDAVFHAAFNAVLNAVVDAVGWNVIEAVGWNVAYAVRLTVVEAVGGAVVGAGVGAVAGVAQWLLLRRQVRRADWWILASTAGWAVGLAVGDAVFHAVLNAVGGAVGWAVAGAVVGAVGGAVAGVAQWLLLRRQVRRAGWWILASTAGGAVGWAVGDAVVGAMGSAVRFAVVLAVGDAVGGAVSGIITGAALVWLLRQPRCEDERKSQPE